MMATLQGLLKPIKDISRSWQIDINDILEQYRNSFVNGGEDGVQTSLQNEYVSNRNDFIQTTATLNTVVDYPQAALVLHGSGNIYQKKVQFLLKLVNDAYAKRQQENNRKRKNRDTEDAGVDIDDEQDQGQQTDFWKPECNLELAKTYPRKFVAKVPQQRRVIPMLMQQLESISCQEDVNHRDDYTQHVRNICRLHQSGVLLLNQESGQYLQEEQTFEQFLSPGKQQLNPNQRLSVDQGFAQPQQQQQQSPVQDLLSPQVIDRIDSDDEEGIGAPEPPLEGEEIIPVVEDFNADQLVPFEQQKRISFSSQLQEQQARTRRSERGLSQCSIEEHDDFFDMLDEFDDSSHARKGLMPSKGIFREPGSLKARNLEVQISWKVPVYKANKSRGGMQCAQLKSLHNMMLQNSRANRYQLDKAKVGVKEVPAEGNDFYSDGEDVFGDVDDGSVQDEFAGFPTNLNNDIDNGFSGFHTNFYQSQQQEYPPFLGFQQEKDDRAQQWERICSQYIENMTNKAADIQHYTKRRQQADRWKQLIQYKIDRDNRRQAFDIKSSQNQLVHSLKDLTMTQTQGQTELGVPVSIIEVLHAEQNYEVSRRFASVLQCYNDNNIDFRMFPQNQVEIEVDQNRMEIDDENSFDQLSQEAAIKLVLLSDYLRTNELNKVQENTASATKNKRKFKKTKTDQAQLLGSGVGSEVSDLEQHIQSVTKIQMSRRARKSSSRQ